MNESNGGITVLTEKISNIVDENHVASMVECQRQMLMRFEKTNEMIVNFNSISNARYINIEKLFRQHLGVLSSAKKDLDSIHKRIRMIKSKLSKQYPEEFRECSQTYEVPD